MREPRLTGGQGNPVKWVIINAPWYYLDDARNFGRYNRVFAEYFADACLSRTTVEARAVIDTKIEMDAIAYKPLK